MTDKEKLYDKAAKMVAKQMSKGKSLTDARNFTSAKTGLSYNTIVNLTKELSVVRAN